MFIRFNTSLKIIIISLFMLFVIVEGLNHTLTKNISISEPVGYYLKLPIIGNIQRGNHYLVCVTDIKYTNVLKQLGLPNVSNQCANSSPYLIKQVVGIPGDTIEITLNGVLINKHLQANSFSFSSARNIKLSPIPIGYRAILTSNQYFVLGTTTHSVDSRYFGIVSRKQFYKQAILIFKEN